MEHLQSKMDYATQLFRTAEYEEANIVFKSLLKTYEQQGAAREVHLCLYRLACVAYVRGEMANFQQLLARYKLENELAHDLQLNIEHTVLRALAKLSLQQYEQAITLFEQVIDLAVEQSFIKQKISAMLYIQKCYIALGRYEDSLQMSDRVWQLYEYIITPDAGQYFHYMLNRADTMLALGELTTMETLLTKCEQHRDFAIMPIESIKTIVARAKLSLAKRAPTEAITLLEQAYELAMQQEDANLLSDIYETLVDNYEQLGDTTQAFHFAKKRLELHKSLLQK